MIECQSAVRLLSDGASSMEEVAHRVAVCLFDLFRDGVTGERSSVMVRLYKTHPYEDLPADLQAFARTSLGKNPDDPTMRCLTLLGTAGVQPPWNDRRESENHKAVPLPTAQVLEDAPMIARLIEQFGLDPTVVIQPDPELIVHLEQKSFGVFHVPEAAGSPYVPAQDFVEENGVRSAIGFGGLLPDGDLFAVIIFSRESVVRETADLFQTVAHSVKVALLPFIEGPTFETQRGKDVRVRREKEALRSEVTTLRQLLAVHEQVALDQARRLEDVLLDQNIALNSLETERQRLRDLLMELPAAVSMYEGPDHILTFRNRAAEPLMASERDPSGKPLRELFPEIEGQGYLRLFDEVYSSGTPFVGSEAVVELERDGRKETRYFDFVLVPLFGPDGEITGIMSHAFDVTEKLMTRHDVEQLATGLRLLAGASLDINAASSLTEVLETVVGQARGLLGAKGCAVSLGSRGTRTVVSVEQGEDELARLLAVPDVFGLDNLIRTVGSVVRLQGSEAVERSEANEAAAARLQRGWIAAPLITHEGELIGTIALCEPTKASFTSNDESILLQLSRIASVAVENVRLYEREHRIAETLQRSLLPEDLPHIPGFTLAARYVPGAVGTDVGGDWYDALPIGDGRTALVLGDVVGKGTKAAAIMSQFRTALRVFALTCDRPSEVVDRLDRFIHRLELGNIATLLYGVLDPATQSLCFVNAGHLPPLLRTPEGEVRFLEGAVSPPIGVALGHEREEQEIEVGPGGSLFLYTDGLIERRERGLEVGMEHLREVVEGAPGDQEDVADLVLEKLLPTSGPTDDVAILSLHCTGTGR
jgi:serine phosphatase RsbU (regulator of sigma subunit)/PAS domain-containing protein